MRILSLAEYAEWQTAPLQFEQQPGWLALLHKHCLQGQDVQVFAESGGAGQAVLPMYRDTVRYMGLKVHRLGGLTGLYSSHYLPVATAGEQLQPLLKEVLSSESWDVLNFSAVDSGGNLHQALTSLAIQVGWPLACRPDFEHWYLNLDSADFDAYLVRLPGALRSTLKRKSAKVDRRFQVRLDICEDANGLPTAMSAYQQIYRNSWKTAERHPDFIPELCHWAACQGWLRLGVMYLDDIPVAAQIWLVLNGRASIFKLAYDQGYQEWSVGSILTAHMMQNVISEEKVTEIDYGKGGEAYKKDWMSDCQQRVWLECYNPATIAGRVMAVRHYYLPHWRDRLLASWRPPT